MMVILCNALSNIVFRNNVFSTSMNSRFVGFGLHRTHDYQSNII